MQNKMVNLLAMFLAGACLTGCVTKGLSRLDDVSSQEAIVVAKFRILYNGKDVTKKNSYVYFNNVYAKGYVLDKSGYFFANLPVGTNSIRNVNHGLVQHHFDPSELTCLITGGGVINYIGDITFDWHGAGQGPVIALMVADQTLGGSPMGGLYAMTGTGGNTMVAIETNVAAAQAVFQQKFATDKKLTLSPLIVKSAVAVKSVGQK
jgi:hypothetical protein